MCAAEVFEACYGGARILVHLRGTTVTGRVLRNNVRGLLIHNRAGYEGTTYGMHPKLVR